MREFTFSPVKTVHIGKYRRQNDKTLLISLLKNVTQFTQQENVIKIRIIQMKVYCNLKMKKR